MPVRVKLYDLKTGETLMRYSLDAAEACRNDPERYSLTSQRASAATRQREAAAAPAPEAPETVPVATEAPAPPTATGPGDDLTAIKGVGAKLAQRLTEAGFGTFAALAAMTPAEARAFEDRIQMPGRIGREDWIGQAKALAR